MWKYVPNDRKFNWRNAFNLFIYIKLDEVDRSVYLNKIQKKKIIKKSVVI